MSAYFNALNQVKSYHLTILYDELKYSEVLSIVAVDITKYMN